MASLFAFPFRPLPNGRAAVVEDGSDDHRAQQLMHLALTRRGERPLEPDVGLDDPAFVGFNAEELHQGAVDYGVIDDDADLDVEVHPLDGRTEVVTITFD